MRGTGGKPRRATVCYRQAARSRLRAGPLGVIDWLPVPLTGCGPSKTSATEVPAARSLGLHRKQWTRPFHILPIFVTELQQHHFFFPANPQHKTQRGERREDQRNPVARHQSDVLGIDGVVVDRIDADGIEGQGDWDPPDGGGDFESGEIRGRREPREEPAEVIAIASPTARP